MPERKITADRLKIFLRTNGKILWIKIDADQMPIRVQLLENLRRMAAQPHRANPRSVFCCGGTNSSITWRRRTGIWRTSRFMGTRSSIKKTGRWFVAANSGNLKWFWQKGGFIPGGWIKFTRHVETFCLGCDGNGVRGGSWVRPGSQGISAHCRISTRRPDIASIICRRPQRTRTIFLSLSLSQGVVPGRRRFLMACWKSCIARPSITKALPARCSMKWM